MNLLQILDSTPEPPIVDLEITSINESGVYNLATPVYEFQRELTDQIVSLHYSDILKYCETNDNTELIVKSLEICIQNCLLVSSHPYLLITHYIPKNLLQRDMAIKLADTSGKFNVLKDLIKVVCRANEGLRKQKNIAIVFSYKVPKLLDLLEALIVGNVSNPLKLKRYVGNYLRRDHKKNEPSNATVSVHLIPADEQIIQNKVDDVKFDLVIKFDEQVDDGFIDTIRQQKRSAPANLIKLIPMLSIEHCKIYYENLVHDPGYLYKLISSIVCLRDQIGILPPDIFPIYNQGLNYLSTFLGDLLGHENYYPPWPLPELPIIPEFTSIDVEKSLLTEVHFHYTPYDMENSSNNEDEGKGSNRSSTKPRKTYYELSRLQLNYITNPLFSNYDTLIGILNHNTNSLANNTAFLTHKLIMQVNNIYMDYELIKEEYDTHVNYNKEEVQERIGRRDAELKKTLTAITDDIDHATSRIDVGNKKFTKKLEDIEVLKQKIEEYKSNIANFKQNEEDAKKIKAIENQIKIWELTDSIQNSINKIKSKQDEKNYMKQEYEKSLSAIKESKQKIEDLNEINGNLNKRLANFREQDEIEIKLFRTDRNKIIDQIAMAKEENEQLKLRLVKSFRYLRDSSHLKKRKGRGITPK